MQTLVARAMRPAPPALHPQVAGDPQGVADAIPGAKCVAIPGCDHFSAIPHALYKAAVFDFLEGWLEEF